NLTEFLEHSDSKAMIKATDDGLFVGGIRMPKDVKQAGISILIVCSALIFSGCGSSSGSGSKAAVSTPT
ncbi:hypothetical protein, partial [Marinobacter sp.]|uniref:hypothetical protein n=1 Tax=Marinobacter sp. TaxID=50741 RepID=UPI003F9C3D60